MGIIMTTLSPAGKTSLALPLFSDSVACGFPSPADDHLEGRLDLNELCIPHPAATFFLRAQGQSMEGVGIHSGDLLIVDRSLTARQGDVVVACLEGAFTVKTLQLRPRPALLAAHPDYPPLYPADLQTLEIFGVVRFVVHALGHGR